MTIRDHDTEAPAVAPRQRGGPLPPNPSGINIPASWYIALPSRDLGRRPVPLRLFDRPLVAWRAGDGTPVVMPRFCPHMGASLAIGDVVDGTLRCPFHHWRFDGSGTCVGIPGVDRVPATARVTALPTVERYGHVWAWHGGDEPLHRLPAFPALEHERRDYVGFRYDDRTTGTTRQLLENAIDYAHFTALHGLTFEDDLRMEILTDPAEAAVNGPPIEHDAWFGVRLTGTLRAWRPQRNPLQWAQTVITTFGAGRRFGLVVDGWPGGQRFTNHVDDQEMYKVLLGITPIAEHETHQRGWALVRRHDRLAVTLLRLAVYYAQNRGGTAQDLPIYNTTATGSPAAYSRHDGPLVRYRRYYQEWVDRAERAERESGRA